MAYEDGITFPAQRKPAIEQRIDHDGNICLVEPPLQPGLERRVFRETPLGWEWCYLAEFGRFARWYFWANKELPSSMTGNHA